MSDLEEMSPEEREKQELNMLKMRASAMGISYSNNIGLDTLRAKIEEKMNGGELQEEPEAVNPLQETPTRKKMNFRQQQIAEQLRLIRVRVTCLDPKKKDLKGEILTVANEVIGNVRKFVPYGDATENGYHIPYCLYRMMKRRQFQQIRTFKKNGQIRVEHSMVREYALEVMEPLTEKEIKQLAAAQAAAGGLD